MLATLRTSRNMIKILATHLLTDLAEKGEFTKRAFLNGRLDLSQAEGVIDLIKAKTEFSHKSAINQDGHLKKLSL